MNLTTNVITPTPEPASALRSQGADVIDQGVRYRTWSERQRVEVLIVDRAGETVRTVEMQPEGDGYFSVVDPEGRAGDRYRYRLDSGNSWPDPASRFQPSGVHEASMVIDPRTFRWSDENWQAPAFEELVIYELHIGTFTREGTFRAAIAKLDHLVSLGVNAIEVMPVADFPGERNWGYDGVTLYAPSRAYGTPDDLRALVDAAHGHGLALILDIVYNHFGPDGNYTSLYHHEYFNPEHRTPWGDAFNVEYRPVRDFFLENAPYWMREFHADGFRLDATHEIHDGSRCHLLAAVAERVHSLGGFVIAEDDRNKPRLLEPAEIGGYGFDGCWSDDFHHVLRVILTGEREGYYANFRGTSEELAETIEHGWLYRGQRQTAAGKWRGGDTDNLRPAQFIYCISNHDQVGNRAFGERLSHVVSPEAYRAASALLCLVPETPMLFMGQEWAASSPFQYFTDHSLELGQLVTRGRRREFQNFAAFSDPRAREKIPDPQAEETFHASRLKWQELSEPGHAGVLALYRECLQLRRSHAAFHCRTLDSYKVHACCEGRIALLLGAGSETPCVVMADLTGGPEFDSMRHRAAELLRTSSPQLLLNSNDDRFTASSASAPTPATLVFSC